MRVFDASAVLAFIFDKPGGDKAERLLKDSTAAISAVNLDEVVARLVGRGFTEADVDAICAGLRIEVLPLTAAGAIASGKLRVSTRALGLPLGDRCCLALALEHGAEVVTADWPWKALKGYRVQFIR